MVALESKTFEKPLTSGQTPSNRAVSGQSGYVIFLGEEPNPLQLHPSVPFPSYFFLKKGTSHRVHSNNGRTDYIFRASLFLRLRNLEGKWLLEYKE